MSTTTSASSKPCGTKSPLPRTSAPRWAVASALVVLFLFILGADVTLFGRVGNSIGAADWLLVTCVGLLIGFGMLRRPANETSEKPRAQGTRKSGNGSAGARSSNSAGASSVEQRINNLVEQAVRKHGSSKAGEHILDFEKDDANGKSRVAPHASYEQVIRACAREGDATAAQLWLKRMVSRSLEPTVSIYNTVLDSFAKADNVAGCERWLKHMLSCKVQPNVISYCIVISQRARRGEKELAAEWFAQMKAADIEPDAVCYNSMIHACSVQGDVAGAEYWVNEMTAQGIEGNVTTYSAVVDACAKSNQIDMAEAWMEKMVERGLKPNVVSFCTVINACAKSADPTRAVRWHEKMVEMEVAPNAHSYSAVINAFAQVGDAVSAEEWLCNAERDECCLRDVVVYSAVIGACAKAGDPERAMAVYHRMRARGIQPHIVAYAALARTFAYKGDWPQVELIANDMAADGVKPNEYFVYAQLVSYASARPREEARAEQCFRHAVRSGVPVNDHVSGALARAVGRPRCNELLLEVRGWWQSGPQSWDPSHGRAAEARSDRGPQQRRAPLPRPE